MTTPADAPVDRSPWRGASTTHYENFPVGSWLLPARVRPAVAALYRFARYADDVADEGEAGPAERIDELHRLRDAIERREGASHPVVTPLISAFSDDLYRHVRNVSWTHERGA